MDQKWKFANVRRSTVKCFVLAAVQIS